MLFLRAIKQWKNNLIYLGVVHLYLNVFAAANKLVTANSSV